MILESLYIFFLVSKTVINYITVIIISFFFFFIFILQDLSIKVALYNNIFNI